eukprot:4681255-Ditylum_brightwellii.AAC.1
METSKCFLGIQFAWLHTSSGGVRAHLPQSAFAQEMITSTNLTDANASPHATPYHLGFPIDGIPPDMYVSTEQKYFYQSWCGMLK